MTTIRLVALGVLGYGLYRLATRPAAHSDNIAKAAEWEGVGGLHGLGELPPPVQIPATPPAWVPRLPF